MSTGCRRGRGTGLERKFHHEDWIGGGALRTIFSSGVCDALLDGGVMVDYVIGVSAGIAYGVSYISRQPRRNLEIVTRYAGDRRYMGMNNLADRHNRSYFGLRHHPQRAGAL